MAFSELETKHVQRAAEEFMARRRPPPEIRPELDFGYRISGQSLELFELGPVRDDPSATIETAIAKASYVKKTGTWKAYWQRADMKWHRYDPVPEVATVDDFLAVVEGDRYACFFG